MVNPDKLKSLAGSKKKAHERLFSTLRKKKDGVVDKLFEEAHDEVFGHTDCLQCANCCKTTGPLFTQKDIARLAGRLKMRPGQFINQYLVMDDEGDLVLKAVPCPFLGADNFCGVYEDRPKACREFPHTNRRKQSQIFDLTLKNVAVCPAVLEILEKIERQIA